MKIWAIFRILLDVAGALTLGVVCMVVVFIVQAKLSQPRRVTPDLVPSLISRAGFDAAQRHVVIERHEAGPSEGGGRVGWYCLQLTDFTYRQTSPREWSRAPETEAFFADALKFAHDAARNEGATCLPSPESLRSGQLKFRFENVRSLERAPRSVEVYLLDAAAKRLYYITVWT